jgi:drug/metabolite transporter (DMT)-like permease
MIWATFAIGAYFLNAFTATMDKFLLSRTMPSAAAYAFYSGLLGIMALFLAPWGLVWPGYAVFLISLVSGATFFLGFWAFFSIVRHGEVSRLVVLVDGLTPVFVLVISYLFLAERLHAQDLVAFVLLVGGGLLISFDVRIWTHAAELSGDRKRWINGFWIGVLAAFLFAISYVTLKYVFIYQSFVSGFVWSRLGTVLGALLILFIPSVRREIFMSAPGMRGWHASGLFFLNKIFAATALVLLDYAVYLGSASMVNALQGIKYAFLFVLVFTISKFWPQIIYERLNIWDALQKLAAMIMIGYGLAVMFL